MTLVPPPITHSWEGCTNQNLCQDQEWKYLFTFSPLPSNQAKTNLFLSLPFYSNVGLLFIPPQYSRLSNSLLS